MGRWRRKREARSRKPEARRDGGGGDCFPRSLGSCDRDPSGSPYRPMSADAVLAYSGVSFSYRGDWLTRVDALGQVDLAVPAGSAYGFLGANGAGKSTSIK